MTEGNRSAKSDFWKWFDKVSAEAAQSEVGKLMTAAGFTVTHTGGGCLAWERTLGGSAATYVWVTDDDSGLGEKAEQLYLCGHYTNEGDLLADHTASNLRAALDWCAERAVVGGLLVVPNAAAHIASPGYEAHFLKRGRVVRPRKSVADLPNSTIRFLRCSVEFRAIHLAIGVCKAPDILAKELL
jgi:hypothetical protein